jgi:putative membrane protein
MTGTGSRGAPPDQAETAAGGEPRRRWPRRVYGEGTEPDPRFTLANERTFLAWLRTGLALLASGVALQALRAPAHPILRTITSLLVIALGTVAAGTGWLSWVRAERALRRQEPLRAPTPAAFIGAGIVLTGALLALGMVWR